MASVSCDPLTETFITYNSVLFLPHFPPLPFHLPFSSYPQICASSNYAPALLLASANSVVEAVSESQVGGDITNYYRTQDNGKHFSFFFLESQFYLIKTKNQNKSSLHCDMSLSEPRC